MDSSGASFDRTDQHQRCHLAAPRAIARIAPVMIPGIARGRTIRRMVYHLLAPQA